MTSRTFKLAFAVLLALGTPSIAYKVDLNEVISLYDHPVINMIMGNKSRRLRQPVSSNKDQEMAESTSSSSPVEGRRLFSYAYFFKVALHGPPHPLHNNSGGNGGSGSGGSSGGGSSGGSSGGGSSSGSSSGGGSSSGSSSGGGSSGGSSGGGSSSKSGGWWSGWGGGGGGGGGSGGSSSGASAASGSGGEGDVGTGSRAMNGLTSVTSITMLIVAAAAAGVAIGAVVMGRRQKSVQAHPLQGAMNRRMQLFNEFGNKPAASTGRPERLVEMTTSGGDMGSGGDYSLA